MRSLRRWSRLTGLAPLIAVLLAACAPAAAPPAPTSAPPAAAPSKPAEAAKPAEPAKPAAAAPTAAPAAPASAAKTGGQSLDELAAAAKAEGSISVITHAQDIYNGWVPVFQARFPDIKVEHLNLRVSDATPRIIAEQKNGVFAFDALVVPTSNAVTLLAPAGAFQTMPPLLLPETMDDKAWHGGFNRWADEKDKLIFVSTITLNQQVLINRAQIPTSQLSTLDDFVKPEFKGKIVMYDPRAPGAGSLSLGRMLKDKGEPFVRQLIQEAAIVDNPVQVNDFVGSGRYAIGIGDDQVRRAKLIEEGLYKDVETTDFGSYAASAGLAILRNNPHPNATKLLANWFLSAEGQEAYAREGKTTSRRVGIEGKYADLTRVGIPEWTNLDQYLLANEWSGQEYVKKVNAIAKEIRP
jgi:ABC-type Fe3+ transport system substrate-binding protein